MNKLPISVSIISGAEAARIGRALESVAGWTSEIVVVLNEDVRDGTEEIAVRHGAKLFREPWKGHIAQKNSAAAKATQPWLLGLDADEAVSDGLREEITRLFQNSSSSAPHAAFSFPRMTRFCGRWIRHGDWYPDRGVRLWRQGLAEWGGIDPHDKLIVRGTTGKLHCDLLHYTNPTINSYVQKINYFSDIFLQQQLRAKTKWSAPSVIIRSAWRFMRAYFFRLGLLDGFPGFFIAASSAYSTLVRHSRLYEHLHSDAPPCPPQKLP